MSNKWSLSGKKAVITGGTKGIGLAIANEFLQLGAEIIVISRTKDDLKNLVRQWAKNGHQVLGLAADLSKAKDRTAVAKAIQVHWGKVDVLVNNVGMNIRKKFVEYDWEEILKVFETNLMSTLDLTQQLFPLLKLGENANVINITSVAGMFDVSSGAPYAMTKAAEIQLTKNLAGEWAEFGIRVNAVAPWYIDTPLAEPVLKNPEKLAKILAITPLNRVGKPEEVAATVAFLAMDKAGFITGQNFPVCGGMSIKGM